MNEIQLAAHDLLVFTAQVEHCHNLMKALKPQWEFKENPSNWIESHVMAVEGDEPLKVANNAIINIADEMRDVIFDAIHNQLNP